MTPRVVDTNVIVAGLVTRDPTAPPARLLDGMMRGDFPFLLSVDLLAEIRTVLLRPALVARHGLSAGQVDRLLAELAFHGIVRHPPPADPARLPDPNDVHLLALLDTDSRAVLVTGDRRLLTADAFRGRAQTPAEALQTAGD